MKQLGMFAKYWQPGNVKTRLAVGIGAERAAQVYRAFVDCLTSRLSRFDGRRVLAYSPGDRLAEFEAAFRGWDLELQADGDLGDRMAAYFRSGFGSGADRVVLIGTDSPMIPRASIERAFLLLSDHDVVLGPSEDGGYYLIGATGSVPAVFDGIPWSTTGVLASTTKRLEGQGVRWATLATHYDVDTAEDLDRLRAELAGPLLGSAEFDGLRDVVSEVA